MLPPAGKSGRLPAASRAPSSRQAGKRGRPPLPQFTSPAPGANPTILLRTCLSHGHSRRRRREQEPEREDLRGRHAKRARRGGGREAGRCSRENAREEGGPGSPLAGREGRGVGRASPRRGDCGRMLPVPGGRRELAEGLRTLGAGRGGADLPDLAAPPPGAGRGLLTSARGFWAMSHRLRGGG